jgi:hypothetical protein
VHGLKAAYKARHYDIDGAELAELTWQLMPLGVRRVEVPALLARGLYAQSLLHKTEPPFSAVNISLSPFSAVNISLSFTPLQRERTHTPLVGRAPFPP